MKITILGSGTSAGIPVILCDCIVCKSAEPKNKRLRSSIFIDLETKDGETRYILIDTGPDFREQVLRYQIPKIDAVLFTHSHADHIFGLDDIRLFNFKFKIDIPVFADKPTAGDLYRIFPYCFNRDPNYEGGGIPRLVLNEIEQNKPFTISCNQQCHKIIALKIFHGRKQITGFRINDFAYLTDCSAVPAETMELLNGIKTLIVSGLRIRPHKTHFNIEQAIAFGRTTTAKNIYFTHIAHEVEHIELSDRLEIESCSNKSFFLCYDGLEIN